MIPRSVLYTITLFLFLLLHPHPSHSHNGAVAIAVPVEGIVVDGDLSDWPEGMREYPIELTESGDKPVDKEDFQSWFRIGYSEQENVLYVAVEVQDESMVIDTTAAWNTQDGCEVYVDIEHKETSSVMQSVIYGDRRQTGSNQVEVKRDGGIHLYEWRIDIGEMNGGRVELGSEILVGLDVVACDKDEDGSFSWMAWGPQSGKFTPDRVGLAILGEETALGKIKGQIEWEDREEGTKLGRVRIQSVESEELWVEVKTDSQGVYEVELPAGKYRVKAGYRDSSTESLKVELKEGEEEYVSEIFFAKPPDQAEVKRELSYKQLIDEILACKERIFYLENAKIRFDREGADSVFVRFELRSSGLYGFRQEIKDIDFPVSVAFANCEFERAYIRFINCTFKNLEFKRSVLDAAWFFEECLFEGNLVLDTVNGNPGNHLNITSSEFNRSIYLSRSKFDYVYLEGNQFNAKIVQSQDEYLDLQIIGEYGVKPIPLTVNNSQIQRLTIDSCIFNYTDEDTINTLVLPYNTIDHLNLHNIELKSISLIGLVVDKSLKFDSVTVSDAVYIADVEIPVENTNISWAYFKGYKFAHRSREGRIYRASNDAEFENTTLYNDLISSYNKFYRMYKIRGDIESANGCYVEMKDIETRRFDYLYRTEGGMKNYSNWRLNQFLKFYCEYGTSPVRALIISVWVILGFAGFYFFFSSDWDRINRSFLVRKSQQLMDYFSSERKLADFYNEGVEEEFQSYEAFRKNIEDKRSLLPVFIRIIVEPILWTLFDKKVPSPHIGIFNHQTKETHTRGKRHHGLGKKDTQ